MNLLFHIVLIDVALTYLLCAIAVLGWARVPFRALVTDLRYWTLLLCLLSPVGVTVGLLVIERNRIKE